ncbi:MAG: hypothetical protein FJ265_01340 [Planctomycetes bacterium]|nr:hypothetical protein [Planctomycetota bacterium]
MTDGKELERLRKRLRRLVGDATGDVAVPAADLRTVLDELGRLQQGNDRLRRQNRRVRLRLSRAGLAEDEGASPADGPPADGSAEPEARS